MYENVSKCDLSLITASSPTAGSIEPYIRARKLIIVVIQNN